MGWIVQLPSGNFSARWRDPTGRERSKTFKTKKAARAHIAEMESAINRQSYVDPAAGRMLFRVHATRWMAGLSREARTIERTTSIMRAHIIPKWGDWPLNRIDHMSIQTWATDLSRQLAPATVAKCCGILSKILESAVRSRLIPGNPAKGIELPRNRRPTRARALSREDVFEKLLPVIPNIAARVPVWLAAGAGLRWGEVAGLPWRAIDFDAKTLRVDQVAVETPGKIGLRAYPKSRAGLRTIPLADWLVANLRSYYELCGEPAGHDLVVRNRVGNPVRRCNYRRRVWLPSLVRAGLLGEVCEVGPHRWHGIWRDNDGIEWSQEFTSYREAVGWVAQHATDAPRFHDLRHSFATWLVSDGLPVNVVQRIMGHEQASTTLNLYTHVPADYDDRVREVLGRPAERLLNGHASGSLDTLEEDVTDTAHQEERAAT